MTQKREALVEFKQVGDIVKVTAVDPETGIEATIQGPAKAGQKTLADVAVKKLIYLLKKNQKK